jgi:5-methylcytosine-specific restriction endonuclease McrA
MIGTWPAANTPSLDHIIPLARGGHHVPGNTQMICLSCNLSKHAKPLDEWLRQRANEAARTWRRRTLG